MLVLGHVQGVSFRWHAKQEADRLRVAGWVKNLLDGRVEAFIEGPPEAVEAMLDWLRRGPPSAHVDRIVATPKSPSGARGFDIRHSSG